MNEREKALVSRNQARQASRGLQEKRLIDSPTTSTSRKILSCKSELPVRQAPIPPRLPNRVSRGRAALAFGLTCPANIATSYTAQNFHGRQGLDLLMWTAISEISRTA